MKLAILASGEGTTAEILFPYASVVVTNNPQAGVINRATKAGLTVELAEKKDLSLKEYGQKLLEVLSKYEFDFISQNGWEMITPFGICKKFEGKITNNHPAPLDPGYPDFGGKGMKGLVVHQAVLNFFKKVNRPFNSEICIHLVNEELDKGSLLAYEPVEIMEEDSAQSLQSRVKEAEKKLIAKFWENVEKTGNLVPIQRESRLIKPEEFEILDKAKSDAIAQMSSRI